MRNLFVRVTVVVAGFGVLAGGLLAATGQAQGPARPGVHLGDLARFISCAESMCAGFPPRRTIG